jgi:hypothetical protein
MARSSGNVGGHVRPFTMARWKVYNVLLRITSLWWERGEECSVVKDGVHVGDLLHAVACVMLCFYSTPTTLTFMSQANIDVSNGQMCWRTLDLQQRESRYKFVTALLIPEGGRPWRVAPQQSTLSFGYINNQRLTMMCSDFEANGSKSILTHSMQINVLP